MGAAAMKGVRSVEGVPDWFMWALHLWHVRRCRRIGHVGRPVPGGVCAHCGHEWTEEDR